MMRFVKWLVSLFYWRGTSSPIESNSSEGNYILSFVSELPQEVDKNIVYIEGVKEKNDYWYALLICPCGCQEKIMLNLIEDVEPCWKLYSKNENFSLSPSIWRTKNCKSHFFIRDNKIVWAKEQSIY